MSGIVINTSRFPVGTEVTAHAKTSDQPPVSGAPGAVIETATVAADSSLTFDELVAETPYWAYATVDDVPIYIAFTTPAATALATLADDVEVVGALDVGGALTVVGALELDGALNHDGTTVGLFGVTPATRPTAFTQTYATATKTHAAPTAVPVVPTGEAPEPTAIAPPAGGTGATEGAYDTAVNRDLMIASVTTLVADVALVTYEVTALVADVAELTTQVTALIADDAATKKVVNQIIDDLQTLGALQ